MKKIIKLIYLLIIVMCCLIAFSTTANATEKEDTETVAKAFIEAVNAGDLTKAANYATSEVIKDIKEYKISNISIPDYTKCEYKDNRYIYTDEYTCGLPGVTNIKDIGLGKFFIVENINGKLLVTSVCATGTDSNNSNNSNTSNSKSEKDTTTSTGTIPQTGVSPIIEVIITFVMAIAVFIFIKIKKYKNIKI